MTTLDPSHRLMVSVADLQALPPSPARDRLTARAHTKAARDGTGSVITGNWNPPRWVRQTLADAEQHRLRAEAARYTRVHAPASSSEIAWAEAQHRRAVTP